jgi:hypothetical protein
MTSRTYGETPERFKQAQNEFAVNFGDEDGRIPRKNVFRTLTNAEAQNVNDSWKKCYATTTGSISGVFESVVLEKAFCLKTLLNDAFDNNQSRHEKQQEQAKRGYGLCSADEILSQMGIFDVYVIELANAIYIKALDMGIQFKDESMLPYACVSISIKFAYLDNCAIPDMLANIPKIKFKGEEIRAMEVHVLETIKGRVQCCTISGLLRCAGILKWKIDARAKVFIDDCIIRCYQCIPNVHPTFSALLRIPNGKRLLALVCVEAGLKQMCASGKPREIEMYKEILREASDGLGLPERVTIIDPEKVPLLCETNLFQGCVKMVSLETSSSISPKTPPYSPSCEKYSLSPEVGAKQMQQNRIDTSISPLRISDCNDNSERSWSLSPDLGVQKKKRSRSPSF